MTISTNKTKFSLPQKKNIYKIYTLNSLKFQLPQEKQFPFPLWKMWKENYKKINQKFSLAIVLSMTLNSH